MSGTPKLMAILVDKLRTKCQDQSAVDKRGRQCMKAWCHGVMWYVMRPARKNQRVQRDYGKLRKTMENSERESQKDHGETCFES